MQSESKDHIHIKFKEYFLEFKKEITNKDNKEQIKFLAKKVKAAISKAKKYAKSEGVSGEDFAIAQIYIFLFYFRILNTYEESISKDKEDDTHSKGTTFKDGKHLISDKLLRIVTEMLITFPGFNYGRVDIKFDSYQDLVNCDNFKVIELNGIYSEPAHIYDPSHSLLSAWMVIISHFHSLYEISRRELNNRCIPLHFFSGLQNVLEYFKFKKQILN